MTPDHSDRTPRRSLAGVRRWLVRLTVGALCVAQLIRPDGWVGETTFVAVTGGAAVFAWASYLSVGGAVRWWIAAALSCSAAADVVWSGITLLDEEPDVSLADAGWIASYVCLAVGLFLLLRSAHRRGRGQVDGALDAGVTGLALSLVLWEFWFHLGDESGSALVQLVRMAYPVLDVMMLALVIRIVAERRTRAGAGIGLAAGVVCWLAADFVWMLPSVNDRVAALLDVGWMIGAALIAAAAARIGQVADRTHSDADVRPRSGVRLALPMIPLLVPSTIALVAFAGGTHTNPVPLFAATILFAGLIAARARHLEVLRADAQAALLSSERLHRALAENSADAVLMLDADSLILRHEPKLASMVGRPGARTAGHRALDFIVDPGLVTHHLFDRVLSTPGVVFSGETQVRRPDGRPLWFSLRAVNLLDDPDVGAVVVNVLDITERKRIDEQLVHQAFHDSLTGLANRALFRDRLEHSLVRRRSNGPAVLYLDLDGFKDVNDHRGHDTGDRLLIEVAARLHTVVRAADTVARLGGDEFAILVDAEDHPGHAESIAARVLESLAEPVVLDGSDVKVSASIGLAHSDHTTTTAASLLRDADVAMYRAKANGKARCVVFEPNMRTLVMERIQLDHDLELAVARGELRLMYQPIVAFSTGTIVGVEALVRWQHPELGLVTPDRFIPLAEANGTILQIGEWVLGEACATLRHLGALGHRELSMAVNVSARQLAAPELADQVRSALTAADIDPQLLVLEMTETTLVDDPRAASRRLRDLRELGVRIAIDDFGIGYSALSYLRQFPVDILKIDRTFTSTITGEEAGLPAIMRALLDLSRTLELQTIAEGVETPQQLRELRQHGCELGQGYLFAAAVPRAEIERLLAHQLPVQEHA